jgi:hypothetical protein
MKVANGSNSLDDEKVCRNFELPDLRPLSRLFLSCFRSVQEGLERFAFLLWKKTRQT